MDQTALTQVLAHLPQESARTLKTDALRGPFSLSSTPSLPGVYLLAKSARLELAYFDGVFWLDDDGVLAVVPGDTTVQWYGVGAPDVRDISIHSIS